MGTQGRKWLARLGAAAILLTLAGPRAEADAIRSTPRYTVTDLGDVLGGVHYEPRALNNAGPPRRNERWAGVLVHYEPRALNNAGQAVGDYNSTMGGGAFYYADGVMRPQSMSDTAINDAGEMPAHWSDRAINNRGETAGSRYFVPWSTQFKFRGFEGRSRAAWRVKFAPANGNGVLCAS